MRFWSLLFLVSLAACGITNQVKLNESRNAYQQCLLENKAVAPCENLRLAFEADRDVVAASGSGLAATGARTSTETRPHTWMQNQGGRTYLCNDFGGTVNCN